MLWSTTNGTVGPYLPAAEESDEEDDEPYPSVFIGPQLRAARLARGLRQSDIARHFDIDSSVPSRWEGYDPTHGGQTTRYKPVPWKYVSPLADYLECSVEQLVPNYLSTHGSAIACQTTATAESVSFNINCSVTSSSGGGGNVSGYSVGGGISLGPTSMAGRPPPEMIEAGQWRRRCPGCHKVFVESHNGLRAPDQCDGCGTPIRARVRLTLQTQHSS